VGNLAERNCKLNEKEFLKKHLNATILDNRGQGTEHASVPTELHMITSDYIRLQLRVVYFNQSELYSKVLCSWFIFKDKYLDYVASNGKTTDEGWIGKDLELSGCNLIETIPRYLLRATGEYHEKPHQDCRYPGSDSNRGSPEFMSGARWGNVLLSIYKENLKSCEAVFFTFISGIFTN
jgi:hypothetical protein